MNLVKVEILGTIGGLATVGPPKGRVVAKGQRKFADVHIMILLGSCYQVLVVLELLTACDGFL